MTSLRIQNTGASPNNSHKSTVEITDALRNAAHHYVRQGLKGEKLQEKVAEALGSFSAPAALTQLYLAWIERTGGK